MDDMDRQACRRRRGRAIRGTLVDKNEYPDSFSPFSNDWTDVDLAQPA
jgi:hypothetical protein